MLITRKNTAYIKTGGKPERYENSLLIAIALIRECFCRSSMFQRDS